jgi:SAM-dependent methyltransferase
MTRIAFMLIMPLLLSSVPAFAQQAAQPLEEPQIGQAGKDVIWVPTQPEMVDKMLAMAQVSDKDFVIDLGSGDGRIVIAAAKRGARAHGVEYDEKLLAVSRRDAVAAGVQDKVTFVKEDFYETDFAKATVLALWLLPSNLGQFRDKFFAMKPGTRIVINSFEIPEWSPDRSEGLDVCDTWCTSHLWIVPAKVEGAWQFDTGTLQIRQSFQVVNIEMHVDGKAVTASGRLLGDQITFKAGEAEYTGRVAGDRMEGTMTGAGKETRWTAVRTGSGSPR